MSDDDILSPQSISEYDQALAQSTDFLTELVQVYMQQRAQHVQQGFPEAITVVTCSQWLEEQVPPGGLASALAVAILDLARQVAARQQ